MRIKYEQDICWGCDLPKLITHKGLHLCTSCNQKRLAKLYRARLKERIKSGKITDKQRLARFFKKYWRDHIERRCFESDEKLYSYRSWHLHHLLPKEDYSEYAYNTDNIIYLSLEMHALWHSLTDNERQQQMPKTWAAYVKIKTKYNVT